MRYLLLMSGILLTMACSSKKDINNTIKLTTLTSPCDSLSAEPFLFTDKYGETFLSWVEKKDGHHAFKFSTYENGEWSAPTLIASDTNWFVNWADYPMLSTDGSENYLAHVLSKSGTGTYAYDIKMFMSNDKGGSWNRSFILHDDGKQAEHGFVSMLPYGDNFFVSWLDGRNTAMEGMEQMDHHEGHHGAMSLRAAVIDQAGNKLEEWELDARVCDCCQTMAAITDNGPVVIYRDRSDEEIRDISIMRLVNGTWSDPHYINKDNWKIAGCPVNGPRSDADGNTLAIAWFSAPDGKSQVNVIFSEDAGETFAAPVRIDEGSPIGRVDIVLINKEKAVVSWMEESDQSRCYPQGWY